MFTHSKGTCCCGAPSGDSAVCSACGSKILGLGRMFLAAMFVVGGFGFLTSFMDKAELLGATEYTIPLFNIIPGIVMASVGLVLKLGGSVALLLGYQTRHAALALLVYVLLATLMFHVSTGQLDAFLRNLALMGGFMYIIVAGGGAWAIDNNKPGAQEPAE